MSIKKIYNYSPNFNLKKRSFRQIKFLVFHYTGMKREIDAINKLTNIQSGVSSHYLIKNNGEIVLMVPVTHIAWHAGISFWRKYEGINKYSIGIEKGLIVSHLEIPSKFFTKGNLKTAYVRGNKKASVILIEFSDYHCPFCRKIQTTINKLIKKFGDRVAFGYRHFPLSFHKEADEAAISSECAR